jgi:hypothetical protein
LLGDDAIISSDFGGNPPYGKMKEVARMLLQALAQAGQCAVHHRRQVETTTDIYGTFRAMGDALREHFQQSVLSPHSMSWWDAVAPISCAAWGRSAETC